MKKYKSVYNTPEYRKRYTGIYGSWYAMKQRCGNPKNTGYKNYGGRGIKYDQRWKNFESFKQDMGETYKQGLKIDRIDNNGNYSKENCRWVTSKIQNNNRRYCVVMTYNSMTMNLTQWADYLGLDRKTIQMRHQRGFDIERILSKQNLCTKQPL